MNLQEASYTVADSTAPAEIMDVKGEDDVIEEVFESEAVLSLAREEQETRAQMDCKICSCVLRCPVPWAGE